MFPENEQNIVNELLEKIHLMRASLREKNPKRSRSRSKSKEVKKPRKQRHRSRSPSAKKYKKKGSKRL